MLRSPARSRVLKKAALTLHDTFTRTSSSSWGSPDSGPTWDTGGSTVSTNGSVGILDSSARAMVAFGTGNKQISADITQQFGGACVCIDRTAVSATIDDGYSVRSNYNGGPDSYNFRIYRAGVSVAGPTTDYASGQLASGACRLVLKRVGAVVTATISTLAGTLVQTLTYTDPTPLTATYVGPFDSSSSSQVFYTSIDITTL